MTMITNKTVNEIWADIKGFEGYYQISNLGIVRSIDRVVAHKRTGVMRFKGRLLSMCLNRTNGYKRVYLTKDNTSFKFYVHVLVANHFIEKVNGKIFINHKDGIKTNNTVDNLEWVTKSENAIHAVETGLNNPCKRESNGNSKLKNKDIDDIIKLFKTGEYTQVAISKMYGVCKQTINNIVRGNNWK